MQRVSSIFSLLIFSLYFGQKSTYYFQPNFQYDLAEVHYLKQAYLGARYDLENLINFSSLNEKQKQVAELYSSNVALLFEEKNAIEEFLHFQEKYPNSPLVEQLYYGAGLYYLKQGNHEEALKFLSKADVEGFSTQMQNNYHFNLGYLYFQQEEYAKAKGQLSQVNSTAAYEKPKAYMLGHISYIEGNYESALQEFKTLEEDPDYSQRVIPYLVQINFNKGEYATAAEEGEEALNSGNYPNLTLELSKIVGESEFRLGNYAQATPYLLKYVNESDNAQLPDYYQLGYVYYVQKDYSNAVAYFNKIINEQSPLAQNASYQLGNAYLQNNQKQEALSAFKAASEMEYDATVKQNGLYNYAMISYDIGNPYEAAAQAIQLYLNTYPNSAHQKEMESLLVNSFLLSKNYKGALTSLSQVTYKSPELQQTEQTLALLYGIELYNNGKFPESVLYFNQAIGVNPDSSQATKANYWKGEALYQMGNYQQALKAFKEVEASQNAIEEKQQLPYEMAYCYLKLEDFDKAKNYFQQYLRNPKPAYKSDAQLRLADSFYGNQDIDSAIDTYGEIEESGEVDSDFAAFQKAKLYGFKGDKANQIKALNAFISDYPQSSFLEEAHYELGIAYQQTKDYLKSIVEFDKVLQTKQSTELTALAMIGKGNDYAALKEYQRALNTYRGVAKEFKGSDYAKQAVLASKAVFIEQGNIAGYQKFAQENGVNLSNEESEELQFLEAQKFYLEKDFAKAIPALQNFLSRYPDSTRKLTSQYYLGDSYYQSEKDDEAIQYLEPIAKRQNEYQEDALFSLGRIYLDNEKDQQAQLAYEALYQITQNKNYQSFCETELMYLYDASENHPKATEMAQKVLQNDKNSEATLEQANVIIARSNITTHPDTAKSQYKALENAKNPEVQAEALFYNAYFKNKNKAYEASNKVIFDLTSNLSDEQYWGARALVVMADNYYHLNDTYQATYILDEVIKSYSEYPDVIKEAKNLQSKIKK